MDSNRILYILCHDDTTEQRALAEFKNYNWARVYRLQNQNYLLESLFYVDQLLNLYDEWKDKDFVGTLSYKFFERVRAYECAKIKSLDRILEQIEKTSPTEYDVVSFMTLKGGLWGELPHLEQIVHNTAESCRMNILKGYNVVTRKKVYTTTPFQSWFFFHNYWMCTPALMLQYISFFKYQWLPALERHPLVWTHCPYAGALSRERYLELTNGRVDHCTYHAYVNELLPAIYFKHMNSRIQFV
jgi:hypothetical protein